MEHFQTFGCVDPWCPFIYEGARSLEPICRAVSVEAGMLFFDIHGSDDGWLSLGAIALDENDAGNSVTYLALDETDLRAEIEHYTGSKFSGPILITPCYPNAVRARFGQILLDQDITIVGDWDGVTYTRWDEDVIFVSPTSTISI